MSLLLVLAVLPPAAQSGAMAPTEYQVKAAFLYNFAKFVEWPPGTFHDAAEPFTVGVLGQDPFGAELELIFKTNTVGGRRVVVKRAGGLEQLRHCQIVFVSASEKRRLPLIFKSFDHAGVLTIGDAEGFAGQGGVIGFRMDHSRVRFQVNVDAAARAGLLVSSRLLNIASVVRDAHAAGKP